MEGRHVSVQQQRREETRRRLMEAGLAVFARKGYEGATLDEVASVAGYSKGAVYVHFPSKEDLFLSILEDRVPQLQERLREVVDRNGPVLARIQDTLEACFGECRQDPAWPGLLIEFWASAQRNPRVRERLANMYAVWRAFIAELLEDSARRQEIPVPPAPDVTAAVLIAIMDGLVLQAQVDPGAVKIESIIAPLSGMIARLLGSEGER